MHYWYECDLLYLSIVNECYALHMPVRSLAIMDHSDDNKDESHQSCSIHINPLRSSSERYKYSSYIACNRYEGAHQYPFKDQYYAR